MSQGITVDATALTHRIRRMRAAGRVHCAVGAVDATEPDAVFLALTGLPPEGEPGVWKPVDRDSAERIAARVLQRDLAYDAPILPERTARGLARDLLALAPPGAAIYTNAPDLAEGVESWEAGTVTGADHEDARLVVGRDLSLVLWVEDDD